MYADEAAQVINEAAWRPGVKVRAERALDYSDFSYLYGREREDVYLGTPRSNDRITLTFELDTYDSSYPEPDGTYRQKRTIAPQADVSVRDLDRDGVLYLALRFLREAQEHEDREFLRVKDRNGDWTAPFHPHRPEGNDRWGYYERPLGRRFTR